MNTAKLMSLSLAGMLGSVALILLSVVDFRRGFLFSKSDYLTKTAFYVFSPLQLILLLAGAAGVLFFRKKVQTPNPRLANALLAGLFALLLLDAGLYRGVAASRSIDAGKVGLDWLAAFGVAGFWQPLALSASYVLTVWHATLLSCLGAGLALLALPRVFTPTRELHGWKASATGTLFAFTQPFCSCCAAITSPSLFHSQKSMNFALATLVGAPLLNISTLILAGDLLPWPYALLRVLGGLLITFFLSYVLSKWVVGETCAVVENREQRMAAQLDSESPAVLMTTWLRLSARIALVLVPSMIVGTVLSSLIWRLWPEGMGNSFSSVLLTAVVGSLVMVSTWSEIPLASQMIHQGLTGPAAAALVALPAVNLGSLIIIGSVSRNWKIAVGLWGGIMLISILLGCTFLKFSI